jgi:hypothetical protein
MLQLSLEINAPTLPTPSTCASPSLHPLQGEMEMEGMRDHGQQLGQTNGPRDQEFGCIAGNHTLIENLMETC